MAGATGTRSRPSSCQSRRPYVTIVKKKEENVASAVVGAPATPGGLVAEDAAALKRRPIVIGWLRKRANKKKGI